jgi:hypothetical protein
MRLRGLTLLLIGGVLAAFVTAACVTDVNPPTQVLWEADLEGSPAHPLVTGSAAAISTDRVAAASISVENLPPGTYSWGFYEGSCGLTGDIVGSALRYEDLVVASGTQDQVSVETQVSVAMPRGRLFHALVQDASSDEEMACGNLEEWDGP